jgi:hypothetical protein
MIQEQRAVQPINWDTALAESERAGGGELQRVPHLLVDVGERSG